MLASQTLTRKNLPGELMTQTGNVSQPSLSVQSASVLSVTSGSLRFYLLSTQTTVIRPPLGMTVLSLRIANLQPPVRCASTTREPCAQPGFLHAQPLLTRHPATPTFQSNPLHQSVRSRSTNRGWVTDCGLTSPSHLSERTPASVSLSWVPSTHIK
jgi:hypothetical protein